MAIVRLTDIVATMKDKWTYGDKFFGYTEEFNDNHNTQYPSLLITPPDSVYPEVTPRNGWEEYSFEVYFSDLYNRTSQQNESIEQRWDNLQDLANEWLDMFLKSYMRGFTGNGTTISYLMDGSLAIERKKEVANDQLLQLKMNFGYRIFSKCFAPVSNYPNQISGLTSWLRADSNVTFSIPTKKVSVIGDGSENTNGVAQTDKELQPLRYTYGGGALDKTMFTFDSDALVSDNNFVTTGQDDFSIFEVSKINAVSNSVFGYYNLSDGSLIEMGANSAGNYEVSVSDGTTTLDLQTTTSVSGKFHIASLRKTYKTIDLNYYDSTSSVALTNSNAVFIGTTSFEQDKFRIGCTQTTDGLIPPAAINTKYLDGDFQEVIIYDRKLTDGETAKVVDYLNKKYRIY
tara:strand:+ start:2632 stop:3834 length:1203 start_codon:yes stop_codon:yes gene_type:complete